MKSLLDLNVIDGPAAIAVYALGAIALAYLLVRRPTRRWAITALIAFVGGAVVGLAVLWFEVVVVDAYGGPVEDATWWWAPAAFGAIAVAIVNLWRSRWWRKVIAVVAIPVFACAAALGINAAYGLNATLGAALQISSEHPVAIPTPSTGTAAATQPLYQRWAPPADLPKRGRIGLIPGGIPNTVSRFPARPAEIYLPPAALVKHAPALPLVIMMMGQPGYPNPVASQTVLDTMAAAHNGLAPIVVVVDELSDPTKDPLCLDTGMGNVETYLMQDVLPWAKQHLNVQQSRESTTIAGYSAGGECSAYLGAKYPTEFGNILAISPELFAGWNHSKEVLADVFGGDKAAYNAVKTPVIMERKAPYHDVFAIYTIGGADAKYGPGAQLLADTATKAGIDSRLIRIPGAAHSQTALMGGLTRGYEALYPRLGLSAPTSGPLTPEPTGSAAGSSGAAG